MPESLEALFEKVELPYQKTKEGGFVVKINALYPVGHSISLAPTKNDRVGAMVEFPPCPSMVATADEFCESVMKYLSSKATLSFDAVDPHFFLYAVVERKKLFEFLQLLTLDCDCIKPLCTRVGETGEWGFNDIKLAFWAPQAKGELQN